MKYERIFVGKGNKRQAGEWLGANGYEVPDFTGRCLHLAASEPALLPQA